MLSAEDGTVGERKIPKWYKLIPLFVIGFLLLAFVRTIGDMNVENNGLAFGFLDPDHMEKCLYLRKFFWNYLYARPGNGWCWVVNRF